MMLGQKFQAWLKESLTLFKREYAATMGFVFAMGAVLGGFAFSPGTGIANPREGGDAATWLAAFGTWVVGYMAWRIAMQSHAHQIQMRRDTDLKDLDLSIKELQLLQSEIITVASFTATIDKVMKGDELDRTALQAVLEASVAATSIAVAPQGAVQYVEPRTMKTLHNLKFQMSLFAHTAQAAMNLFGQLPNGHVFSSDEDWVVGIAVRTSRFHEAAEGAEAAVHEEIISRRRAFTRQLMG